MASQMHVAYSSAVTGVGIVAGGAYHLLHDEDSIDLEDSIEYAYQQSNSRRIDDLSNLEGSPVWLFSGTQDTTVSPVLMKLAKAFYRILEADIKSTFNVDATHGWITDNYGAPCNIHQFPWINNCGIDAAAEILSHIYKTKFNQATPDLERVFRFDQTPYFSDDNASLSDYGYMYYPKKCEEFECELHVMLHGCVMTRETIGGALIINSGFNELAEGSGFIILYPQVRKSSFNPDECWDYKGFTGPDYSLKSGLQLSALYRMTQSLPTLSLSK